jgi:hypothetical protein
LGSRRFWADAGWAIQIQHHHGGGVCPRDVGPIPGDDTLRLLPVGRNGADFQVEFFESVALPDTRRSVGFTSMV